MIALLTDFGTKDNYTGIVKGVIKSLSPESSVLDVTHDVEPYSIINGQYLLFSAYRWFPRGTVFLAVVDPGVGTDRKGVIAVTEDYLFVAPDNGILSPFIDDIKKTFYIDFGMFPESSGTFHGRDIFARVAAGIDGGKAPEYYGGRADTIVEKKFPPFTIKKGSAECVVLHVDRFGNVITSLPGSVMDPLKAVSVEVRKNDSSFYPVPVETYGRLEPGIPGILFGSSGFIELSMNMCSLAERENMKIGDRVQITYE